MGGVLSIIVDIIELTAEVTAATGFSLEAIINGEALAAVEAQLSSLATVEGLSGVEALASLGITTEQYSFLTSVPGMLSNAVGLGVVFQTVSGASALVSAGIATSYAKEVSVVNRNMALVPWRDPDYYDILFPGVQSFSYAINVVADWSGSLFHAIGRYIWDTVTSEARRQIGHASNQVIVRGTHAFQDSLARILENARWVVQAGPTNIYNFLDNYYRELPPVNPPQARQMYRRLGQKYRFAREAYQIPDRYNLANSETESGETVEFYKHPGGANQRVTPDWMLPLILGLYGDITPTWSTYVHEIEEEDESQKKKRRRY
ncbi:VP2 [Alphapolyomavirus quartipanos]|uniref:Minor capsid protein n=1 Tax=Alphapolyomavirus quartipanos TaxID=1891736 RepID=K7QKH3_9POLY|nr:VP2 [Alphapolyomavirus quartipanos]AFU25581.1 VP2 [Alphapolyomavirus quartipanos]